MARAFYDISVPVYGGMIHWPTDPPVSIAPYKSPEKGDRSTVSLMSLGTHTGTHVDPPRHFFPERSGVDQIEFEKLIGPCQVVDCHGMQTIGLETVRKLDVSKTPRVLFHTDNSEKWWAKNEFTDDYVGLEEDAAKWLVAHGALLVGVDSLSVEKRKSPTAGAHHALLEAGAVIVEGLNLAGIEAGVYDLVCLPLRIRNGDGAPARAVLVR